MTDNQKSQNPTVEGMQNHTRTLFNKGILNDGTCSTEAANAAKEVTLGTTFALTDKATIIVTFANAISAANATLAVTHTDLAGTTTTEDAKPIYYNGAALASGLVQAGSKVVLRYNASVVTGQDTETGDDITGAWEVLGSLGAIYENFRGSGSNHKAGLVPDPGATEGTVKYLREDGTWQTPPNTEYESKQASQGGTAVSLVTTGEKHTWNQKQNALTFDNSPVQNSSNPVKSGGLFTALADKQDTITDRSFIGDGSAVCSTDAATQEKAVTITNFVLLKYGFVSVRFQKGVKVSGATLKINDNTAKAILIDGMALPAGVIRENVTALMQYDGTNFNIVSINAASVSGDGLLVDLGLPSGLKWATRNIDVTQPNGFAASPYQHECSFFSWGNTDGHNPVATNSFGEWSWGNSNDVEPYVSSPGHDIDYAVAQQAGLGYDAAHVNLGGPWKMPTTADFAELFNAEYTKYIDANGDEVTTANNVGGASYPNDKRVVVNGCVGLYLESKVNGKRLFFPASGYGSGASWSNRGATGYYWSSSLGNAASGRDLNLHLTGIYPQGSNPRFYGFTVRPVQ